jgi:nucleotide-binding universal stress UspA family protein
MIGDTHQVPALPTQVAVRPFRPQERRGRQKPAIHVPLDGSLEAKKALPFAAEIARLTGAAIHIVYVSRSPIPLEDVPVHLHLKPEEILGASIDLRTGNPVEAILQASAEYNGILIAMTTHGGGSPPEPVGIVAAGVVRKASCPVLMIRPEARPRLPIRRVLLPLDGTPSAAQAIIPAVDLAHLAGADLIVLHVAPRKGGIPLEPGTMTTPRYVDQPQHEWPSWASEFMERFASHLVQSPYTVPTELFLTHGQPGSEILLFAYEKDIDLIVLERRGNIDRKHANLMTAVLRRAPCPVLLLHKEIRPFVFATERRADVC